MNLNKSNLDNLIKEYNQKTKVITFDDYEGLSASVGKRGVTFRVRKTYKLRDYNIKLGKYPNLSIADVKIIATKTINEIYEGKHNQNMPKQEITLFGELFEAFIESRIQIDLSKNTIKEYSNIYKRNLKKHLGRAEISKITKSTIKVILDKHKNTPSEFNHTLAMLSAIFEFACENELRKDNPVKYIKKFKINPIIRFLDKDEEEILFSTLQDKKYLNSDIKLFIYIAITTGLRKSNVLSIKNKNIDFDKKTIFIEKTKNGNAITVYMTEVVAELIKKKHKRYKKKSDYLFNNKDYNSHVLDNKSAWYTLIRECNIECFRRHDLRHTFATKLIKDGTPIVRIQKALGHKSITMTTRYAHLDSSDIREDVLRTTMKIGNQSL